MIVQNYEMLDKNDLVCVCACVCVCALMTRLSWVCDQR